MAVTIATMGLKLKFVRSVLREYLDYKPELGLCTDHVLVILWTYVGLQKKCNNLKIAKKDKLC